MPTALRAAIQAELPDLVRIRRDLHQHPELSWEERRTSALAARELTALGMTVRTALAKGTGLVGYLPATRATP
ncbi:MAG: hypothetical protein KDA05_12120, partial [Phycisphaerales bacterium]|nr:hypothetical protein [Phycisphaerales bacterium]